MSARENLAVHTALTEAENRHDLSHHRDFLHDDIELHQVGGPSGSSVSRRTL